MNKLAINEFNQLSTEQKIEIIGFDAHLISSRKQKDYHFDLYGYSGFYIELCFGKNARMAHDIHAFTANEHLTPYLKNINVLEDIV